MCGCANCIVPSYSRDKTYLCHFYFKRQAEYIYIGIEMYILEGYGNTWT